MSEFDLSPYQKPASVSIMYTLLTALAGFIVVGPLIGFVLAIPFIEGSFQVFVSQLQNPLLYPQVKTPVFIIQASATFFGLIIGPALYWRTFEKRNVSEFVKDKSTTAPALILTGIAVLLFNIPDSVVIDWNAGIHFPEFMKGFETWAREREDYAEKVTTFLTTFGSTGEFLFAFFVVAVLPGIGEELVFRGMLQNHLQRATNNPHAAIWISAFMFSALHMQFFGFVPRMFLGALFGYLYYWSGNLILPMFAHFVNNGFSILVMYLLQLGVINIDVTSNEVPPLPVVIIGTIFTFGLLFYLKGKLKPNTAIA